MKQHSVKTDNVDEQDTKEIWKETKKDKKKKQEDTDLTYSIGDLINNLKIEDM